MGERKNIAAFTEFSYDFPAYISINREPDGRITVTAREQGDSGNKQVTLDIPERDLIKLAYSILERTPECRCGPNDSCPVCDPGG